MFGLLIPARAAAGSIVLAAVLIGTACAQTDDTRDKGQPGVIDVSIPMSLYQSGDLRSALKALESPEFDDALRDGLGLEMLVADSKVTSADRALLARVAQRENSSRQADAALLLAAAYEDLSDREGTAHYLNIVCPRDAHWRACLDRRLKHERENAELVLGNLDLRLLVRYGRMIAEYAGHSEETEMALIVGLYFDHSQDARARLLAHASEPLFRAARESYCRLASIDLQSEDRELCASAPGD
jgi:hypothetical protein